MKQGRVFPIRSGGRIMRGNLHGKRHGMVYHGKVKDGTVVLEGTRFPPNGASVSVRVLKAGSRRRRNGKQPPTLYDRLKNVIGKAKDMPVDASINIDHYLYGAPKRK